MKGGGRNRRGKTRMESDDYEWYVECVSAHGAKPPGTRGGDHILDILEYHL